MKKFFILSSVVAIVMMAMSCSNSVDETAVTGQATIKFSVINYQQVDLDELFTRSTSVDNLNYLELGVYDATTRELVYNVRQANGDSGYGTFNVTLPYGDYTLIFLGWYSGQTHFPDMTDPDAIVFDTNYVPNLFCETMELTINADTEGTQAVQLSRVIASFGVTFADELPTNSSYYKIFLTGGGYVLNPKTGRAVELADRTYTIDILSSNLGRTGRTVNIFTLLTGETAEMEFVLGTYDENDVLIAEHTFREVPMKINQYTHYTGNFFTMETSDAGFTISLAEDYEWEEILEGTYTFSE